MTLTYAEIAEIIKLIDASSCEEVTLDLDEIKLTMRRQGAGVPAPVFDGPNTIARRRGNRRCTASRDRAGGIGAQQIYPCCFGTYRRTVS